MESKVALEWLFHQYLGPKLKRNKHNWIVTYTGAQFWPTDPIVQDIHVWDLAHGLANKCRFTGQMREFYSVAQHCVIMSYLCPDQPKWALLHDASEAYLPDVAGPIKDSMLFFNQIEENLLKAIALRFDLEWPIPTAVKVMDRRICLTEALHGFPNLIKPEWHEQFDTGDLGLVVIDYECWEPKLAEHMFLQRFGQLFGTRYLEAPNVDGLATRCV